MNKLALIVASFAGFAVAASAMIETNAFVNFQNNEPAGTQLTQLVNSGSDPAAVWTEDAPGELYTTGSGELHLTSSNLTRYAVLAAPLTNGNVHLVWRLNEWNFDGLGGAEGISINLRSRIGSIKNVFSKFVTINTGTDTRIVAQASDGNWQQANPYPGITGSRGMVCKLELDLDAGTFNGYYKFDGDTDFTLIGAVLDRAGLSRIDDIVISTDGTWNYSGNEYVNIDYITLTDGTISSSIDPEALYTDWAAAKGLTKGVNDGQTDNPDNDQWDNLAEYALGGDPLAPDSITNTFTGTDGETNWFYYIHPKRNDAADRGLIYEVRQDTSLFSANWAGTAEEAGTRITGDSFDIVTNRVPLNTETAQYLRLYISDTRNEHDPNSAEELRIRGGLPNFFSKLETQNEVRVAYLGGSITLAEGWRVKSFDWLQKQYPAINFIHINAAVGGTGADFGACRLEEYVLSQNPDLIFVEYRVNGGGDYPERAFEGVLRRIWETNPKIDICYVYTIGEWMINALSEGKQPGYGVMMEKLANHYGIPSIELGLEVTDRLQTGTLSFNVQQREEGKLWFSKDACHPTDEGHDLYLDIISRSLEKLGEQPVKPGLHQLPFSLKQNHYHQARYQAAASAQRFGAWEVVDVENDAVYTDDQFRTQMMLDSAFKTSEIGAGFTVEWDGPLIAFTHIPQQTGIEVEVSIDGNPPQTFYCDQSNARMLAQYFYLPEQGPGQHTATLTVTKLPDNQVYYAGQFLVLNPNL